MFFEFFLNAICERTLAKSFIFHEIFVFFVLFFSPKDTPEPLKRCAKTRSFSRRRCIFGRSVCAFFRIFLMTFQVPITSRFFYGFAKFDGYLAKIGRTWPGLRGTDLNVTLQKKKTFFIMFFFAARHANRKTMKKRSGNFVRERVFARF